MKKHITRSTSRAVARTALGSVNGSGGMELFSPGAVVSFPAGNTVVSFPASGGMDVSGSGTVVSLPNGLVVTVPGGTVVTIPTGGFNLGGK